MRANMFLSLAVGFLTVYLSIPIFRYLAFVFEILDIPGGRKIHQKATPLLGGVAVYCGMILAVLFSQANFAFLLPVITGATIILTVGLLDDMRGLSPQVRLLWQFIAATCVIAGGGRIDFLPPTVFGAIGELLVTYLWIIGVTNALNCLDGMDGLAGGIAVLNLSFFGFILFSTRQCALGMFALIVAACCMGFLPYNFRREKMFLGDAGSTFLGFILASIALVGYWAQDNIVKISIPLLVLGVPIFDMVFTTIMRVKEGKISTVVEWLKYAGKDHFHHYLVDVGFTPSGAVVFIYWITISLGISAFRVSNDRAIEAFLALAQAFIIFCVVSTLMVVGRRRRSGWKRSQQHPS